MYTYEQFIVGKTYGSDDYALGETLVANWLDMFPGDDNGECIPPGILILVQGTAYRNVITPRPPGAVQGGQEFDLYSLPKIGSTLRTEVVCGHKEIRKERRWLKMNFTSHTLDGLLVFKSVNTILLPV